MDINQPKEEFRFDYSKYQSTSIPMENLEGIRKVAISTSSNIFDRISIMVQVLILVGIEWLRMRKMNEEMLIKKQEYEIRRTNQGSTDLGQDDLD